jgi:hypothetical protein
MPCAARYQKTPSFEFILNPFKFFFTNYVKKSPHSEDGQASLVGAVSVTYNLGPLATIKARINAASPTSPSFNHPPCRVVSLPRCMERTSNRVCVRDLAQQVLPSSVPARRIGSPQQPFDDTAAASSFPAPSQTHPVRGGVVPHIAPHRKHAASSQCCLARAHPACTATHLNVRNPAIDYIATRCYTFMHTRLFVPAYRISFNID